MTAMASVLTSIVTQLKASSSVTTLATGGVFNNVPQDTAYPYVVVGAPNETRWDCWGAPGKTLSVQVEAVSNSRGDKEAVGILNACIAALHFQRPTVANHNLAGIVYDEGNSYKDPEMVGGVPIYHATGIFRVQLTQST